MKRTMKTLGTTLAATLLLGGAAWADDDAPDAETVEMIMAKLEEMNCQMAPDDIEVEDDGYELDDVICEGGQQYDIMLDADLNETGRRAE